MIPIPLRSSSASNPSPGGPSRLRLRSSGSSNGIPGFPSQRVYSVKVDFSTREAASKMHTTLSLHCLASFAIWVQRRRRNFMLEEEDTHLDIPVTISSRAFFQASQATSTSSCICGGGNPSLPLFTWGHASSDWHVGITPFTSQISLCVGCRLSKSHRITEPLPRHSITASAIMEMTSTIYQAFV